MNVDPLCDQAMVEPRQIRPTVICNPKISTTPTPSDSYYMPCICYINIKILAYILLKLRSKIRGTSSTNVDETLQEEHLFIYLDLGQK